MDAIHPVKDNSNVMYVTLVTHGYQLRIMGKDKWTAKFVVQLTITAMVTAAGRASCRTISGTINHGILPEGKMIM